MYLLFDTETTGLPKKWKAPITDVDNWPRLVQIAWLTYKDNGEPIEQKDYIVYPEGFTIPAEASNVHRITTERAKKEGIELKKVLEEFAKLVNEADYIVAHNINFDEKIIGAEFIRNNISTQLFSTPRLCTMKNSTNYCKISGQYGYKWPKLSELHIKLFGKDFEDAHDAAADIGATGKCFWEMKRLNLI